LNNALSKTLAEATSFAVDCEAWLISHDFVISARDPSVKPGHEGAFMVTDPLDNEEGFAIVGDDRDELIIEAYEHLS